MVPNTIKATSSLLSVIKAGYYIKPAWKDHDRIRKSLNGKAIVVECRKLYDGSYLYYKRFPLTTDGLQAALEFLEHPVLVETNNEIEEQ